MNSVFINVVGHNSSGKTYLAQRLADELGLNRINGDDFRLFVYEHINYFKAEKLGLRSEKNDRLNKFLVNYRIQLSELLLDAGQSVILDGSGATKHWRSVYLQEISKHLPEVKSVLIYASIQEKDLLKRLAERDEHQQQEIWTPTYHNYRKGLFESPDESEADYLLVYNQNNYFQIKEKLSEIIER